MQKHLTFITGGQRSGKSSFAQALAEKQSEKPIYLATARKWDEDFIKRIQRHQSDRSNNWQTIEEEKELGKIKLEGRTVVLDCITLWLTNIFHDNNYDVEISLEYAKLQWKEFSNQNFNLIVVSNELGMGIHPEQEVARKFTDLQGWMNQYIAQSANEVYLMVAGISLKVK
jgi:adenosylcobinamide kinase / adenosylcobinamide-phosphate guanylyltransferase